MAAVEAFSPGFPAVAAAPVPAAADAVDDDSCRKALSFASPAHEPPAMLGPPAEELAEPPGPRRMQIFLRVRPLLPSERDDQLCLSHVSPTEVQLDAPGVREEAGG
jgi:hypothetical protein